MSRPSPRVALLVSGDIDRQPGGAAMRWRALRAALGGEAGCLVVSFGCDRQRRCRTACAVTGGPPPHPDLGDWWFTSGYCDHAVARLAERLRAEGVSTVVCSGLETHLHTEALAKVPGLRVVYDMHNVEFPLRRTISRHSGELNPFLSRIEDGERRAVLAADAVWTCSDHDARLVVETYPGVDPDRIHTVPNAVPVTDPPPLPAPRPRRVCFTGHLWWYPNVDAVRAVARDIAPRLRAAGVTQPVVVAGLKPSERVVELCRDGDVELVADPPETRPLIRDSVMIVPLALGGGTRLKALEAFALGAPLVSTAKGVEGLDVVPGEHYLRAETPDEFTAHVTRLLEDDGLRTHLVASAWRRARDHYSVEALRGRVQRALTG